MAEYIEGTFGPAWKKTLGGNLRPVEPTEFAELDKGTQLFDSQGRSLGFIKEVTGDSVTMTSVRGDEAEGHTAEVRDLYVGPDSWVNANEAPVGTENMARWNKPGGRRVHIDMKEAQEATRKYMKDRYSHPVHHIAGSDYQTSTQKVVREIKNHAESLGYYQYAPGPPYVGKPKPLKPDMINHPPHYAEGRKHEPKDVIRDWGLNYNLGSAVKYISRAGRKENMIQDIDKAIAFLGFEREALLEEKEESE